MDFSQENSEQPEQTQLVKSESNFALAVFKHLAAKDKELIICVVDNNKKAEKG